MAALTPSNIDELSKLAQVLGLTYPSNPQQVNTAVLILAYLMSRGMGGVKNILRDSTTSSFYLDNFAQEIYTIFFKKSGVVYTSSKSIDLETDEPEYTLGTEEDAKLDLIEYKIRKELLTLIEANPSKIDQLEQFYDSKDELSPFGWVNKIGVGYFNILLGGRDRSEQNSLSNRVNSKLNKAVNKLNTLPAEGGKDSINKG